MGLAVAVGLAAESASYGFRDPAKWVPDLLTGWILVGCGLAAWHGRPHSRLGPLLTKKAPAGARAAASAALKEPSSHCRARR